MSDPITEQLQQREQALAGPRPPGGADAAPPTPTEPPPLWGLALSGGGIRSATFCFGLLVALARHQALLKFHLMSTVSGGGFIGALLGRLFHRAAGLRDGAQRVQDALADADKRWFTWWLRANSNYLFARGTRDVFVAAATMLRNLVALHIELALLAVALGALLAGLDLAVWQALDRLWNPLAPPHAGDTLQRAIRHLPAWLPTLALALAPLLWAAATLSCAYWALPRRRDGHGTALLALQGLASLAVSVGLWVGQGFFVDAIGLSDRLWMGLFAFAVTWTTGCAWAAAEAARPGYAEHQASVRLTQWLGALLRAAVVVAGIGVLDRVAWWMAFEAQATASFGAALLAAAGVLRLVLPALGGSSGAAPQWLARRLLVIAHVGGLLLSALLAAWWIALLYRQVFGTVFVPGQTEMQFMAGHLHWLFYFVGAGAFLVLTGHHVEFANLSSLHRFYRARLIRGWLGAANAERFPMNATVLARRDDEPLGGYELQKEVSEVHPRDDEDLTTYAPHAGGGPVHLINVCLNQTQRGKGPFNGDRKGQGLTAMAGGWMRIGERPWQRMPADQALTLGSWTAISGAAFAPGLGMLTRSGIAALAMFAGVRLGYWWDTRGLQPGTVRLAWLAKSRLLLRELLGRFRGDHADFWYLSDGGHFENTAAYALLRERTRLIVLADCGGDPEYRFADLENLVRKARVDLGAAIHFLKPDATHAGADWRVFGSVADLASPSSDACMAIAEIEYRDGSRGWLVLVKPNMFSGLPVDLINFKAEFPDFPQQSTSDQAFEEPQWESYFMLGRSIGQRLPAGLLQRIADGEAARCFKRDDGRMLGAAAAATGAAAAGLRARLTSGAVGASIGLTTAATLGVSVWQALDAWRTSASKSTEADDKALKELTDLWGKLRTGGRASPPDVPTAQALAASLLRIGDTLCPNGFDRWFKPYQATLRNEAGLLVQAERLYTAQAVLNDARYACQDITKAQGQGLPPPSACTRLVAVDDPDHCLYVEDEVRRRDTDPHFAHCPPSYWGRDYRPQVGNRLGNCLRVAPAGVQPTVPAEVLSGASAVAAAVPVASAAAPTPPVSVAPAPAPATAPTTAPAPTTSSTPAPVTGARPSPAPAPAPAPAAAPRPPPAPADPGARAAAPPPAAAATPSLAPCQGKTVYLQVYGRSRDPDDLAVRKALQSIGASVPVSEDMVVRAQLRNRVPPTPVRADMLRWHGDSDEACARALVAWMNARSSLPAGSLQAERRAEPLATRLRATPGVVELWLAPPPQTSR
ncbi:patatin-like phospholipase family protein [Ideonella sp. A 288]|uniref:patatin-like phospholipase family protein n=1 Tax=Ideonella sp. A 288 TaxID=1962181 RepID=UPI001303DA0B|nr:patatin-like phospholipase family protein [Ideonella sp. A 288]